MSPSRKDTSNLGNSEQTDRFWSIGDISVETALPDEYKGTVQFEEHGHVRSVSDLVEELHNLFSVQNLAVLATTGKTGPYGNLIAFMASHDLKYFVFSTQKATRKFGNLSENPNVAFVIDNRSNKIEDFVNAVAVTAMGKAFETFSEDRENLLQSFIEKHPHLKDFVTSPSCALVKVEIEKYVCVFRFQNVIELYPKND